MIRPADTCPAPVLAAWRAESGYLGLSHGLVCKIVQGRDWIRLQRMFRDDSMPSLVEHLLKAAPGHAESLIELAAIDPEMFSDRRDWRETEKRLKAFVQVTETYRSRLASLDWMAVQTKSNIETDFAITGRFMDMERLIASLDAHLSELVRMCELPRPAKDAIHWGASRPGVRLKIRLLRDAAPGVPRALIAELINLAENLPDKHLLTEEDIR